ncbi:hypothetical protein DAPPUDRAFT_106171 [Daphnia pulex]|uniref:Uncharacterized protein n=1 Tax=Daphnia pulex TaxID=6669 RepID=E9GT93_DAPPU|nr:hypothetical protein DAPPUDRAFT_106171 [Daphnia pulex]|eukprot:EFX77397.1 hypothetical protein DAPPUDRAFT_106171 [Daphnia pulex]
MASVQLIKTQWIETEVFKFFKLTSEVIEKITIDSNASEIVRRDEKRKLGEEWIHGTRKFCKYNSKQHPVEHQKYKILMSESSSKKKRPRFPDFSFLPESSTQNQSKSSKQESIADALNPNNIAKKRDMLEKGKKLPQEVQDKINIRAFELIVAEALSLSIVESVYFRNYSKEIESRVNVLCTKSLKLLIAKEFVKFKSHIKNEIQKMIPDGTIIRMSAAIACLRFPGSHTHENVAENIKQVMDEYGFPAYKNLNFVGRYDEMSLVESAEPKLAEHVANEAQQFEFEDEVAATSSLLDELDSEELDEPSVIDEAASLATSAYDLLQQNYEYSFTGISMPDHLRYYRYSSFLRLVSAGATGIIMLNKQNVPSKKLEYPYVAVWRARPF